MTPHVVVLSHERSGTHLTIDTLRHHIGGLAAPYVNLDRLRAVHESPLSIDEFRRLADTPRVWKSHAPPDHQPFFGDAAEAASDLLRQARLIYVCRDGRDVMASFYHYARVFDPEADVPFSDFLRTYLLPNENPSRAGRSPAAYWAHHTLGWLHRDVQVVSFEGLSLDTPGVLADVSEALGLAITREPRSLVRTRDEAVGTSLVARAAEHLQRGAHRLLRGVDYTSVGFRSGRVGGHRALFSPDDLAYFDAEAGEAMRRLGYVVDREGLDPLPV